MTLTKSQATILGCVSPILWGLSVSLIRILSQTVGVAPALALNYALAFVFTGCVFGIPNLKKMPVKYYICGIGSAVVYTVAFSYALSFATNGTQTMEIGMINYLWPSLTIIFAVVFNKQPAKWWLSIGLLISLYGIFMVLSGSYLVDFGQMFRNFRLNPLSYSLGFLAAVTWPAYSNFTKAWANGQNPTVLVYALNTAAFYLIWGIGNEQSANWSIHGFFLIALMAVVMGSAYGLWTIGVQKGEINLLSIASFFTPVISCLFASVLIGAQLHEAFWAGVSVVVVGSLICWAATRNVLPRPAKLT